MKLTPYNPFVIKKGQFAGVKSPGAKLTEEQAIEILRLKAEGIGTTEIAKRLGANLSTVSGVYHRRTWRHLSV